MTIKTSKQYFKIIGWKKYNLRNFEGAWKPEEHFNYL
jgi:hypothetical protein